MFGIFFSLWKFGTSSAVYKPKIKHKFLPTKFYSETEPRVLDFSSLVFNNTNVREILTHQHNGLKKGKVHPVQALRLCTGRTAHRGSISTDLLFPDHGTRRGEGSGSRPGRFYPRERPSAHCTGGWVGPRAGLDGCGKLHPPPGFDPRTVQFVASRYTDWATGSSSMMKQNCKLRRSH